MASNTGPKDSAGSKSRHDLSDVLAHLNNAGGVSQFSKAIVPLVLMMILFFSGFGALGMGIFYWQESRFFQTAVVTEAIVENVIQGTRQTSRTENNRTVVTTETVYTAHVRFRDSADVERRASLAIGSIRSHEPGMTLSIAYQPHTPTNIRASRAAGHVGLFQVMFYVFGTIFLTSLILLIWMATRSPRQPPSGHRSGSQR